MSAGEGAPAFARPGAIAGVASTLVFTATHQLVISNIWSSAPIMLVAGGVCGAVVAWSYSLLPSPSLRDWLGYNALYVAMLMLLGLSSLFVFEPVTTIAALIEADEPPTDLIRRALPMTAPYTVGVAVVVNALYRRSWPSFGAALVTSTVLVALLGLNVAIIGLVDISVGAAYLVAELLGLIALLDIVYAATFAGLERSRLAKPVGTQARGPAPCRVITPAARPD